MYMHAKVRLVYKFWFSRIIRKLWLVFFFLLSISRIIYTETHFLENIFLLNYTHKIISHVVVDLYQMDRVDS